MFSPVVLDIRLIKSCRVAELSNVMSERLLPQLASNFIRGWMTQQYRVMQHLSIGKSQSRFSTGTSYSLLSSAIGHTSYDHLLQLTPGTSSCNHSVIISTKFTLDTSINWLFILRTHGYHEAEKF